MRIVEIQPVGDGDGKTPEQPGRIEQGIPVLIQVRSRIRGFDFRPCPGVQVTLEPAAVFVGRNRPVVFHADVPFDDFFKKRGMDLSVHVLCPVEFIAPQGLGHVDDVPPEIGHQFVVFVLRRSLNVIGAVIGQYGVMYDTVLVQQHPVRFGLSVEVVHGFGVRNAPVDPYAIVIDHHASHHTAVIKQGWHGRRARHHGSERFQPVIVPFVGFQVPDVHDHVVIRQQVDRVVSIDPATRQDQSSDLIVRFRPALYLIEDFRRLAHTCAPLIL